MLLVWTIFQTHSSDPHFTTPLNPKNSPEPNLIAVHVGYGYHVEMTPSEAQAFIPRRVAALER